MYASEFVMFVLSCRSDLKMLTAGTSISLPFGELLEVREGGREGRRERGMDGRARGRARKR